jgi:AcrR family transcriptional regulator
VAAIAEQAGVAIGNLHYHFGSRAELLLELMRWQVAELLETVRTAIEAHTDFFAKDEAAFRAYLGYVRRHPACVRLAEEVRLHHPKLYGATNAMWLAMFRDALRAGSARGELRPLGGDEIDVLAQLLMGARYFVDQMLQADGAPDDEVIVGTYVRLTRGGLRRPQPGGRP